MYTLITEREREKMTERKLKIVKFKSNKDMSRIFTPKTTE